MITTEYRSYTASFRKEYQDALGTAPYVCPVTQWLW